MKVTPRTPPRPPQHGHEDEGGDRLDHVAMSDQVQCNRAGEQQDRDEPSRALATPDAAGDCEQADARERNESTGGLAHPERDVAEQGMQSSADLRWHDGRDEVGEAQDRDAGRGEPPHPAKAAGRIGDRWPDEAPGEGGDDRRCTAAVRQASGREALQHCHRTHVATGEKQPCVHLCARLDLDPGDLLEMDEDRRQAEPGSSFLDDFAA
jgi:hypothetical protein